MGSDMTRAYPTILRPLLVLLSLFGLGACNAPSGGSVSACEDSATTQCLMSYPDWSWADGAAWPVQL